MQIDDALSAYFTRPLMCVLAASDAAFRPTAGRGVGFHLFDDRSRIEILFSSWQWPQLEAAIDATGKLAVTFVSPSDYVSFQLKGLASLRPADQLDELEAARFIAAATGELHRLGVPKQIIAPWLTDRGLCIAQMQIREIYVQTPGPLAGMAAQRVGG